MRAVQTEGTLLLLAASESDRAELDRWRSRTERLPRPNSERAVAFRATDAIMREVNRRGWLKR